METSEGFNGCDRGIQTDGRKISNRKKVKKERRYDKENEYKNKVITYRNEMGVRKRREWRRHFTISLDTYFEAEVGFWANAKAKENKPIPRLDRRFCARFSFLKASFTSSTSTGLCDRAVDEVRSGIRTE